MSAAGLNLLFQRREWKGSVLNSEVDCFSLYFKSRIFLNLVIRMVEFCGVGKRIPIARV